MALRLSGLQRGACGETVGQRINVAPSANSLIIQRLTVAVFMEEDISGSTNLLNDVTSGRLA